MIGRWVLLAAGAVILAVTVLVGMAFWSTVRNAVWDGPAVAADQLVQGWATIDGVPGALLHVEVAGQVVLSEAAGWMSNDCERPLQPDAGFHIASIGKLFTAATVLRLSERGLLNLDAPVAEWLGAERLSGLVVVDGVDHGHRITARQLLTHRAGLGNTDSHIAFQARVLLDANRRWSVAELLEVARELRPAGRPGERTSYASPGYWLLGLLIEAVADRPYHEVVRLEVIDRLGLDDTFEASREWTGDAETMHHYVGWFDLTDHHPSFEFADGGFVSTAPDLARFGRAVIEGRLFDRPETLNVFLSPAPGEARDSLFQAHGPLISRVDDRPTTVLHQGFWGTALIIEPEIERVSVIALGQSNASTWEFWRQARDLIPDQPHGPLVGDN
ncbi:MAG: serine hydrolase domain-containing protein [Wenzhouxiangella sp.]|nr:serine hydrolase domain-containing protein [Wenzhouxiangella sp.]